MTTEPRISMAGTGAFLLDAAGPVFDEPVQHRIWSVAAALQECPWVRDTVPGMNNLLVVFDPMHAAFDDGLDLVIATIRDTWHAATVTDSGGRTFTIPVHYDGDDLAVIAAYSGLPEDEIVRRHVAGTYRVGAIGAMPGYPYLFGLDPRLACPRRSSPRASIPMGAVIIGGPQTAIMPCTAPSGWHVIGMTDLRLFDPAASPPALLRAGDVLRFESVA